MAAVLASGAAVGNYSILSMQDQRVPVLVVARTVGWGQRITDADLAVAKAAPDPAVHLVGSGERSRVVGMTAATTLVAGSLVSPNDVTDQDVPGENQEVIGLLAKPGQLPARGLRPGDRVEVTPVASGQSGDGAGVDRSPFAARVVGTGPADANGAVTVDVVVDSGSGSRASAAAGGPVVIAQLGVGQ